MSEQLERAWEDCLAVATRAMAAGKRWVGIQHGYRLVALTEYPMYRTCYCFDGFSVAEWASNILYALEQENLIEATADEIDAFLLKEIGT